MNYIIENDLVKVEVSDKGGELYSMILKSDGTEYLWQRDAKYWKGGAYNLFPICGGLYDGKYIYKGKTYEMTFHGVVRDNVLSVNKISDEKIAFTLVPNDEIRAMYPFDFEYTVTYALNGTSVSTEYSVKNNGKNDMYFGVGGHPGFNVPLTSGESFEDYYLEFDDVAPVKKYIFEPEFDTIEYQLKDGKIFELEHSLFDIGAIFLTDMSRAVTLKSKTGGKSVRVEYPGFQNLGIWHAPKVDAPYICIEPWDSIADKGDSIVDIEKKTQMTCIAPNEIYKNEFRIIVK